VSDRRRSHDLLWRACDDHVSAQSPCSRSKIENKIGVADGLFIVLDDEHRVAQVAKFFESLNEAVVVALMQADGGLVEDVEDAAQARADLRGEADALALAAGERSGAAVEREIVEADGAEELETLGDLAANALGDQRFALSELEIDGCRERAIERQGGEVGDGKAADFDGERLGAQALAAADGAGRGRHVAHHVFAIAVAARFLGVVAQVGEDAVEAGARRFALGRPVDENVLLFWRQIFEWRFQVDLVAIGGELDELDEVLRRGTGTEAAIEQRLWTSR
jgi:hypothetical protein